MSAGNNRDRSFSNPFFGLINYYVPSPNSETSSEESREEPEDDPSVEEAVIINQLAEEVFHITVKKAGHSTNSKHAGQLVCLDDLASSEVEWPSIETLKMAIFERLLLEDPSRCLVGGESKPSTSTSVGVHVVQKDCLFYLLECYKRLRTTKGSSEIVNRVVSFVICDAATALRQPILFEFQNIHRQVIELFEMEDEKCITDFIHRITETIVTEEVEAVIDAFKPVLTQVQQDFARATISNYPRKRFSLLQSFIANQHLAKLLVDFIQPVYNFASLSYVETLLGAILNISCLPKKTNGAVEFFEKPLDGSLNALEGTLWTAIGELGERASYVVESLMRAGYRSVILTWIGGVLDCSLPRGRLNSPTSGYASDAFALNLAAVLLTLSRPLKSSGRYMKIDPTYSATIVESEEEAEMKGVHCKSLIREPCLQPANDGPSRRVATNPFSFMSELFHLTHRALDLSVRVVFEQSQQLYQDIGRTQQMLNDIQDQFGGRPPMMQSFRQRMEEQISRYLCMRCALLEPSMLEMLGEFSVVTADWLIQVMLDTDSSNPPRESYAPLVKRELVFPLPENAPPTFRCIPELVVENIVVFLRLTATYTPQVLESGGPALLNPLLTLLIVMMGSKTRGPRNPHLRASLAQALECLLPKDPEPQFQQPGAPISNTSLGMFQRQQLFLHHPHRLEIVKSLMEVFVSIESGQSVAFEQKFKYRRPMYTVMDHLWTIPCHREVFKNLAKEAERSMEEVSPPLFLRFLNLLMNDAIFLLDEALSNMAQLRNLQVARDSGEWDNQPLDERERQNQSLREIGMIARFDNILGKETIHTLEYMSSEIKSIFWHSTMVDRIAAMLNYFLYHLVGPKKKELKVKDQKEFMFSPGSIVLDICRIYCHLGQSDDFCSAISRDGRSYSPQLFSYAQDVLARVGGVELVTHIRELGERVEQLANKQQREEELLAEAPEEFLDPIMSTLMIDPVILPSSRITVDRSTIARHLLSDQTDPFNRSPLTMNMVKSNYDLKGAIEAWVMQKKAASSSTSGGPSTSQAAGAGNSNEEEEGSTSR